MIVALRALGERYGLSGLRVWRLFSAWGPDEEGLTCYKAGRPGSASLKNHCQHL